MIEKLSPMLLAVAPNGARKQYSDHPSLPITAEELAATAKTCLAAGAGMMHVHVRDKSHQHCIDADLYCAAFSAIRGAVGDAIFLQATTEAVGIYTADEQMAMVKELAEKQNKQNKSKAFGVSIAVSELMPTEIADSKITDFFEFMRSYHVLPQIILYSEADRNRFQSLLRSGVLPGRAYPCLFVLGRYNKGLVSNPVELLPFFSDLSGVSHWMGCAFGEKESAVAKTAGLLGGHMRIGYENNTLLSDGRVSLDNAELIAQTATDLSSFGRRLANAKEAVEILTPDW